MFWGRIRSGNWVTPPPLPLQKIPTFSRFLKQLRHLAHGPFQKWKWHFHCVGIKSKPPSLKWFCKRSDCHSALTANKQQEPGSNSGAAKSRPPLLQFDPPVCRRQRCLWPQNYHFGDLWRPTMAIPDPRKGCSTSPWLCPDLIKV